MNVMPSTTTVPFDPIVYAIPRALYVVNLGVSDVTESVEVAMDKGRVACVVAVVGSATGATGKNLFEICTIAASKVVGV